jgi:CxxC motif-containing protein (DUF1111 family)
MAQGPLLFAALCFTVALPAVAGGLAGRDDLSASDRARVVSVTALTSDFSVAEPFEAMPGGAATTLATADRDAFSQFSANLSFEDEESFKLGNALFRKLWVASPSSTQASDGLGPLFNARSCQSCHLKDGRGHPPFGPGDDAVSMFLRLSVPPRNDEQQAALDNHDLSVIPEPTYGTQLQNFAVPGVASEGRMSITYTGAEVMLADGTIVTLRAPEYSIENPAYGPLADDVMLSPRIAPQMIGLGLLEAVHEADILARADPEDADGDGVSGRPNRVRDPVTGEVALGRFGWKAGAPSVMAQSAGAFAGDIGIATPLVNTPYGDCTDAQAACLEAATGVQERLGDSEAPDPVLELVSFYSRNLAVPRRRDVEDPQVLGGKQVFYDTGCVSCHTPKYVTRRDAIHPAQQFQLIWPYTDMLLHDLGDGLADHRPEGDADGNEWRTAPLWGIGLTGVVSGHTFFLHDGRARSLLEAILWHGGEAQEARDKVVEMSTEDREALLAFVASL